MLRKTIRKIDKPSILNTLSQKKPLTRSFSQKTSNLRNHLKIKLKPEPVQPKEEKKMDIESRQSRDPKEYLRIPEVPSYEPTLAEFRQPFLLFKKLKEKGYEKYGAVKIIPPKNWDPEFSFDDTEKLLTTRIQVLRNLTKGKSFDQNVDAYTQREFKKLADDFQNKYKWKTEYDTRNQLRKNEYEYWSLVEDPKFEKIKVQVEYAADLPSRKYGSAFPTVYRAKATDELDINDESTHPFNLNNVSRAKDSLFQVITTKLDNISGISSPWVYSGMLFATFCWHVEDLYMYSLNYMHKGATKSWYCVPGEYKEAFDKVIREKYPALFEKNPSVMYGITLAMNPLELMERKIPVYRADQNEREFILTFPKVYHCGFSHGYNVSEAVNFASADWIPAGKEAMDDYAKEGYLKKASFPYEWLILENIRRMDEFEYAKPSLDEIIKAFEEMKKREFFFREAVENNFPSLPIKRLENNINRYDAHVCHICRNYCYLSFLCCSVCNKKTCLQHLSLCPCQNPITYLNLRFRNEELNQIGKELNQLKKKKK